MQKFFQNSREVQVDGRHRAARLPRPIVEAPLSAEQTAALKVYSGESTEPFKRLATKPATPAARRFQGWRVP